MSATGIEFSRKNMEISGNDFINNLHPENLRLFINQNPFCQSRDSSWSITNTCYRDYDLFTCFGGEACFYLNSREFILKSGMSLLVGPDIQVEARHRGCENFRATAQHFDLKIFGELDFFSLIEYRPLVKILPWDEICRSYREYTDLNEKQTGRLLQHALLWQILARFIEYAFISVKKNIENRYLFIMNILTEIDRHISDPEIDRKILSCSPYSADYTCGIFKKLVGMRPREYILKKRLDRAKEMLQRGFPVKEAAREAGFSDELYFSKVFKLHEKITPSEYKAGN